MRKLQRYDEALSDFNRALELKSTWLAPRLGRVALYIDQQEYDIAMAELKISFDSFYSSRKLFPWAKKSPLRSRALILRATVFQKKGNHKKATKDLKESLKIDSALSEAHFMLGLSLESLKKNKKAQESYREFLRLADASDSLNVKIAKVRLTDLSGQ